MKQIEEVLEFVLKTVIIAIVKSDNATQHLRCAFHKFLGHECFMQQYGKFGEKRCVILKDNKNE